MGMINRLISKLNYKEIAIFVDEDGNQKDMINLDLFKNNFTYNERVYFKDIKKYSNFQVKIGFKSYTIFVYDLRYSEPIPFNHTKLTKAKNDTPYIAKDIYYLLQSKVLSQVNRQDGLKINFKLVLFALGGIVVAFYFLSGGSLV